jgi:hypothetical protein
MMSAADALCLSEGNFEGGERDPRTDYPGMVGMDGPISPKSYPCCLAARLVRFREMIVPMGPGLCQHGW